MACVEEEDCRVLCGDGTAADRVRREVDGDAAAATNKGRTEDWLEKLEIRVVASPPTDDTASAVEGSGPTIAECRLYLIVTLATALTFCLLSGAIVIFACLRSENAT